MEDWKLKAALIKGQIFKAHDGDGTELILSEVVKGSFGVVYVLTHPKKGCVFCTPKDVYISIPPPSKIGVQEWKDLKEAHQFFVPEEIKFQRMLKALGLKKKK